MSVADDYEDLRHLVDRLTPSQVRHLRVLVSNDAELAGAASAQRVRHSATTPLPESFTALAGSIHGPGDIAERHDDYIRQRLQERFGDHA
jgi:hypothetical protein